MQKIFIALLAIGTLATSVEIAGATTCQRRAEQCAKLHSRAVCFDKQRMRDCRKSGTYQGVTHPWEAKDR